MCTNKHRLLSVVVSRSDARHNASSTIGQLFEDGIQAVSVQQSFVRRIESFRFDARESVQPNQLRVRIRHPMLEGISVTTQRPFFDLALHGRHIQRNFELGKDHSPFTQDIIMFVEGNET